jgi:two-component system, NtrC family, nitrogen regulation sensor histidine kinase NtrY
MKVRIKRENAVLAGILLVYVLYFGAVVAFSVRIETIALFQAITESRALLFSLLAFFSIMFFLVLFNLAQIIIDRFRNREGAKFRLRLTVLLLIITSIPFVPLSIISNNFITKSIGFWFVSGIEDSLDNAMEVSRELYGRLSRESIEEWEEICSGCSLSDLRDMRFETIDGIVVYGADRTRVEFIYPNDGAISKYIRDVDAANLSSEGWKRVPIRDEEYLFIPVKKPQTGGHPGFLYLVRKVPAKIRDSTQSISMGLQNYRVMKVVRRPIQLVITLVYIAVIMPFVLLAFYLSLIISKSVTNPIRELAIATRKIAEGELDYRIRFDAKDELRMLIRSFNGMAEELQMNRELLKYSERSAAWRDIAQKIAHEIKNPLTPIRLSAERILKLYQREDKFREILAKGIDTIINEVKNITAMVNEFSSFARFPESKIERCDITSLLGDIVSLLGDSYKNVQFSFHHKEESVYLLVDGEQLRRAILNIVYNGINALAGAPNGESGEGAIRVECYTPKGRKDHFTIAINDNGAGIDDGIKDLIFKPYFSKDGKGSGLGLAIAEKIVFENKGRIWFESRPGSTTFYLEFPKA